MTTGTKETTELVKFLGQGYVSVRDALKDGVQPQDILAVLPIVQGAFPAFQGIEQIPAEVKDLDSAEGQKLLTDILVAFNIASDENAKLRAVVSGVFKIISGGVEIFGAFKA